MHSGGARLQDSGLVLGQVLEVQAKFTVDRPDAPIIGPHDALPSVGCEGCGGAAVPRAFLPDLVVSREKRIVIEVSGKKSSIHDRTKVDFYYGHGIRWIEVTNETVKSHEGVRAICQALAMLVESSHPERVWSGADFS